MGSQQIHWLGDLDPVAGALQMFVLDDPRKRLGIEKLGFDAQGIASIQPHLLMQAPLHVEAGLITDEGPLALTLDQIKMECFGNFASRSADRALGGAEFL